MERGQLAHDVHLDTWWDVLWEKTGAVRPTWETLDERRKVIWCEFEDMFRARIGHEVRNEEKQLIIGLLRERLVSLRESNPLVAEEIERMRLLVEVAG